MQMLQVLRRIGLPQGGEVLYADVTSVTQNWSSPRGGGTICRCYKCYAQVLSVLTAGIYFCVTVILSFNLLSPKPDTALSNRKSERQDL
jgi:hypothetical protein